MTQATLSELQALLNRRSSAQHIVEGIVTKGTVGSQKEYKFVVNSNDHQPPHFHVSVNDRQIAKYSLSTGKALSSTNSRLDKKVEEWLSQGDHLALANEEWKRFHGDKK